MVQAKENDNPECTPQETLKRFSQVGTRRIRLLFLSYKIHVLAQKLRDYLGLDAYPPKTGETVEIDC